MRSSLMQTLLFRRHLLALPLRGHRLSCWRLTHSGCVTPLGHDSKRPGTSRSRRVFGNIVKEELNLCLCHGRGSDLAASRLTSPNKLRCHAIRRKICMDSRAWLKAFLTSPSRRNWSERWDSNPRLFGSRPSTLTRLRYVP